MDTYNSWTKYQVMHETLLFRELLQWHQLNEVNMTSVPAQAFHVIPLQGRGSTEQHETAQTFDVRVTWGSIRWTENVPHVLFVLNDE